MKKIKNIIFIFIIIFIMTSMVFAVPHDLNGHWAKATIEELISKGIIAGYRDESIKPDNFIKRAEFMIAVNKLFDFNDNSSVSFDDINGSEWYANDVSKAFKAGYISGYKDNTIKAESFVTRQETAVMIQRILNIPDNKNGVSKFKDSDKIDDWSKGAIGAVASLGIINGYTDGTFGASKNITRAEAFTMINKAYNYKNNKQSASSNENMISNYNEFKDAISNSIDNLDKSITLQIKNYDENLYDLNKLGFKNVAIKVEGSIKGNIATLKCVFEYPQDFKLNHAVKNPTLTSKLDNDDISVLNKLKSIVSETVTSGMTSYQKEKAIHDYIVLNYKYDTQNTINSNTIKYFLENKSGICEAYANTFNLLSNLAGLDCDVVTGTMDGVGHAWNIIKLDGEYYHIDVTSDDPIPDKSGRILYNNFNLNDDEISKTHKWDKANTIACSGQKYNYFIYNNLVVTSIEQMKLFVSEKIKNKYSEITIYTKGFTLNGIDDFKFINNYESVKSIEVTGEFKKEGAFVIKPQYR